MKIQQIDTPIGPIPMRRKLLLGLPSTFALATPFALIGCGGSDDDESADTTPPPSGGTPITDPPGPLTSSTMSVKVQLPDAIAAAAGAMRVVTATGSTAVASSSADVAVIADGPQLVSVIDANGNTVALGWAGKDMPPVTPQSTAAVLLTFGLGLPFLGAGARDGLRTRLLGQPAVTAFGDVIATELRANPKALTNVSAGIVAGFEAASAALLPAASGTATDRKRALGLVVDPATDQSGLQVVQGDTLNSFFVDNAYVRRAVVIVNREGWVDSAGVDHNEPAAPVQVGEVMDLPLPTAIDSVANVVGGWANEYYAPEDQNGFWRSVTDTVTLEITPSDAKRTRYNVVVLTAGAMPPADMAAFSRLPASQQAYITGLDLGKNLSLQMWIVDLLAPLFFEILSSRVGRVDKTAPATQQADKAVLQAFAAQMLSTLQSKLPEVTQKVADGSLDAWSAFKLVLKACTFNPDTGEISPLLQEFLVQGATLCAKALADAGLRSHMLEIATGLNVGGKNVLGFIPVLKIISLFDAVLGKAALLRIVGDSLRSRRMVSWGIVATKAKVVLKPDPLELKVDTVTYPITVEIVDNDNDEYGKEKGSISFDWECTGLYGKLYSPVDSGLANPNHFTTSATNPTVNYIPDGSKPDPANPDQVTVKAYFEPIGSGGTRSLIGSATAPLKVKQEFSVTISPSSKADLPADTAFPLKAFINEKVPAGSSIRWEWTHSGAGLLDAPPVDGYVVDCTATLNTGSTEGTANVSVRAVITVPASGGQASRTVTTESVKGTFGVKKGLRTVTFEVGGGEFVCGQGCGVENYTAFIVPMIPKAISYTAVLSGFGYPSCNRSVTWNSPKGDGGGCNFPVSYHPIQAGSAAFAWAVWIGFGGPVSGKCVVTVTLPAA